MADANHHAADPEKLSHPASAGNHAAAIGRFDLRPATRDSNINVRPFVGRLGGQGSSVVSPDGPDAELLKSIPDAAPNMTLAQQFDLRSFRCLALWKAAVMEGMGMHNDLPTFKCRSDHVQAR
jgi:hypothetical protein